MKNLRSSLFTHIHSKQSLSQVLTGQVYVFSLNGFFFIKEFSNDGILECHDY